MRPASVACQAESDRRRTHGRIRSMAKKQRRKNPHAVALGRKGAAKGAKKAAAARWANVSPEERSAAARKAAEARWRKDRAS
jgi:hypothetical protein